MLNNRQTILRKQSPPPVPPPHSYTVMQFRSTPNDDDDDICPVCESECTCGNTNSPQTTTQIPVTPPAPVPSLKIKLLPLKPPNSPSKPASTKRARMKSNKQKQTTAGSATVDGVNNNSPPQLGQSLGRDRDDYQVVDSPPAANSSILRSVSPLTPEPELEPPVKPQGKPKRLTNAAAPKNKKKASIALSKPKQGPNFPTKKVGGSPHRKKKDQIWTGKPSRRKTEAKLQSRSADSVKLSEDENPFRKCIRLESDEESVQFPTFISAMSTSSGNDDDSASITSDSFDTDSSVRAEEENMILVEERARFRREILKGDESWHMEKRKWDHLKNNNNWEIVPRKRSVGAGETESEIESDTDSEDQQEEDEEGEGDDDDEPDIRYGRGMVTGWQSDDDDLDAELFFATLADSSGPGSDADAEDEEESDGGQSDANSDLSEISLNEAVAAGLLSSPSGTACPLVVTEDWDGRLVFANGLKDGQGVLDVHFEANSVQRCCNLHRTSLEEIGDTPDGDDDEEDIMLDDGDTTDDMLDHDLGISTPQGVVPISFRCPTPPVTSIDPLFTLSPFSGSKRLKRLKGAIPSSSPKPADILASSKNITWENAASKDSKNGESSPVVSPPETAASTQSRRMPSMGTFKRVSRDPTHSAVIDGSKRIVSSPFSLNRRMEKQAGKGRKRPATEADNFPYVTKRVRHSSLPGSNRAPIPAEADDSSSPRVQSSPEMVLREEPIDLDDVLDAAFLDSDDEDEAVTNTSGERHIRNLSRWDRVPMGTFRRSRTAHLDENSVCVPRLMRNNDGVSYGSAGGHVLRKSPLGAALWQNNSRRTSRQSPGSVYVSPVIFPQRDGDESMNISQLPDLLQKPLLDVAEPSKSRKQKRKDKKKVHRSTPSSTNIISNEFYHVTANVTPLSI